MGRGGEVLPSRDSTRIAKTFILTLQRYELFLNLPNFQASFFSHCTFYAKSPAFVSETFCNFAAAKLPLLL